MQQVADPFQQFLYRGSVFYNQIAAFFSHEQHLHNARFASIHKLRTITSPALGKASLLLGEGPYKHILRVAPTPRRRELGNVLAVAPGRGGKDYSGLPKFWIGRIAW